MVDLIIDGFQCSKCNKYHPTMRWHEKYGYEDTRAGMRERIVKSVGGLHLERKL